MQNKNSVLYLCDSSILNEFVSLAEVARHLHAAGLEARPLLAVRHRIEGGQRLGDPGD